MEELGALEDHKTKIRGVGWFALIRQFRDKNDALNIYFCLTKFHVFELPAQQMGMLCLFKGPSIKDVGIL